MPTAYKIEYKDARLVMLPTDAINPQARDSLAYLWSLFFPPVG